MSDQFDDDLEKEYKVEDEPFYLKFLNKIDVWKDMPEKERNDVRAWNSQHPEVFETIANYYELDKNAEDKTDEILGNLIKSKYPKDLEKVIINALEIDGRALEFLEIGREVSEQFQIASENAPIGDISEEDALEEYRRRKYEFRKTKK
jgi:hypothetical protein